MKKIKITRITLIGIVLILIGIIFIISILINKIELKRNEITNYIIFESAEYESIENIVFYSKETKMDDDLKNNLTMIANELKVKYPNKSILYLRNLSKNMYRCMQIENGQIMEDTYMNVLFDEDGNINIQFVVGSSWKSGNNTEDIKITQEQAKKITINYLLRNSNDYKELKSNKFNATNNERCLVELCDYNFKICWKMQFSTGDSYMIIDANTGKILDKYFFCGVITG
jgi:hypothetical protein